MEIVFCFETVVFWVMTSFSLSLSPAVPEEYTVSLFRAHFYPAEGSTQVLPYH
jgi:hypothetical protein